MAKAKKLYWLGKGLLKVDGKLYGEGSEHGRAFPTAKLDKDRLAKWQDEGLVSDQLFIDDASNTVIDQLKVTVKELSGKIVELNNRPGGEGYECEGCTESAEKIAELEAQVEALTEPSDDKKKD